jgi:hypothetical protein
MSVAAPGVLNDGESGAAMHYAATFTVAGPTRHTGSMALSVSSPTSTASSTLARRPSTFPAAAWLLLSGAGSARRRITA